MTGGFCKTAVTVNVTALEVTVLCPLNWDTVTGNAPALVSSEAGTFTDSWLLLTKVVGRLTPLNCTVEPEIKPCPNTDNVKPALPCWAELGLRLLIARG